MVKTCYFILTEYDSYLQNTTFTCSNCDENFDDEYHFKIRKANYCQNCGCKIAKSESGKFSIPKAEKYETKIQINGK